MKTQTTKQDRSQPYETWQRVYCAVCNPNPQLSHLNGKIDQNNINQVIQCNLLLMTVAQANDFISKLIGKTLNSAFHPGPSCLT